MKRFRFRLEAVLRLRRMRERQWMLDLARCHRAVADLELQIHQMQRQRRQEIEALRAEVAGARSAGPLIDANAYLFATSRKIERHLQAMALFKVREARARSLWTEAAGQRKAVERLRENRLHEWRREFDRQEQKDTDEVALVRYARAGQEGSLLGVLGAVFLGVILVGSALATYLFSTGKVTLAGLERARGSLRSESRPPLPVRDPAEASEAKPSAEETALERARRLQEGSQALMASVRAFEKRREQAREEAVARQKLMETLREELRGELENLKRREAELAKERQSIETARNQAGPPPAASTGAVPAGKFLQMIKTMRPREIQSLLSPMSDSEVAGILAALDTRLSAKIMKEWMNDPQAQGRVAAINDLLRGAASQEQVKKK